MQQLDLPGTIDTDGLSGPDIEMIENFLAPAEADHILQQLITQTSWEQPRVRVYGKWHLTPRLVCFHADPKLAYAYSDLLHDALPWTPLLTDLKQRISDTVSARFNAVLLNYYRNGQDTIGWHADDERELGEQAVIASLSVGATRELLFKPRNGGSDRVSLTLTSGSLLIMRGDTQHRWLHHLPRRARCVSPRVNLTFRLINPAA